MDPLSIAALGSAAISGGASLFGGISSNAANAAQAAQANYLQSQEFINSAGIQQGEFASAQAFNADQAAVQRNFVSNQGGVARDFNAQQAQLQRDWQTGMANTAYQRAVSDMKRAGLNPILSAGTGGAVTPGGATASIGIPMGATAMSPGAGSVGVPSAARASMSDVFSPAVSSAMQGANLATGLARAMADVENVRADTANKLLGPGGSVAGIPIPAVKKIISDVGPAVSSVVGNLLPPPGPNAAATVNKQLNDLGLGAGNTLPSGAPANIPSLVPGALGKAIMKEISGWISPPTAPHAPGNAGNVAAPVNYGPVRNTLVPPAARSELDRLAEPNLASPWVQ